MSSPLFDFFPTEIVKLIHQFAPKPKKKKSPPCSPSLQKELQRIQLLNLKGKNNMYLRNFDDFCLD